MVGLKGQHKLLKGMISRAFTCTMLVIRPVRKVEFLQKQKSIQFNLQTMRVSPRASGIISHQNSKQCSRECVQAETFYNVPVAR
jgi:hypothetical protein